MIPHDKSFQILYVLYQISNVTINYPLEIAKSQIFYLRGQLMKNRVILRQYVLLLKKCVSKDAFKGGIF